MNIKGSLTLLILQTILPEPKHGYRIAKEIKQKSQGTLSIAEGTLYPILHDLEKQGFIEAFEHEIRGRTRRSYRLTAAGHTELESQKREWEAYSKAVNLILGELS